jgi:hypothetical protein
MDQDPRDNAPQPESQPAGKPTEQPTEGPTVKRRYGAARIRPRTPGAQLAAPSGQAGPAGGSPSAPLTPDIIGAEPDVSGSESEERYSGRPGGMPFGGARGGGLFGPRSFGGGRVQVFGCSPGCLIISLIVSVILTLLLNAIL